MANCRRGKYVKAHRAYTITTQSRKNRNGRCHKCSRSISRNNSTNTNTSTSSSLIGRRMRLPTILRQLAIFSRLLSMAPMVAGHPRDMAQLTPHSMEAAMHPLLVFLVRIMPLMGLPRLLHDTTTKLRYSHLGKCPIGRELYHQSSAPVDLV